MKRAQRKTAPRVVGGKVQKKNRTALTPNYFNTPQDVPVIDRRKPGAGFMHLLTKRQLIDFISILPYWELISQGLDAVVLDRGSEYGDGWYDFGVVAICAWNRDLWRSLDPQFVEEHRALFERLGVPCKKTGGNYLCKFNESTARAYQLLHVFPHELGHHRDRMTTRSKTDAARGEGFAEWYAYQYEETIWSRYLEVFGQP